MRIAESQLRRIIRNIIRENDDASGEASDLLPKTVEDVVKYTMPVLGGVKNDSFPELGYTSTVEYLVDQFMDVFLNKIPKSSIEAIMASREASYMDFRAKLPLVLKLMRSDLKKLVSSKGIDPEKYKQGSKLGEYPDTEVLRQSRDLVADIIRKNAEKVLTLS